MSLAVSCFIWSQVGAEEEVWGQRRRKKKLTGVTYFQVVDTLIYNFLLIYSRVKSYDSPHF